MTPETCKCCGRYTEKGRQQLAIEYRSRPLSDIDLTKPLSELIEGIRYQIIRSRSQLEDIGSGFTGWRQSVENVQGLLTCGLISLHYLREQMLESERLHPQSPQETARD